MPDLNQVLTPKFDKVQRRIDKRGGMFQCVTVTPFTVYLNGDTTVAVPALKVAGLTYIVGTKGRYIHDQGQQPLCIPTA